MASTEAREDAIPVEADVETVERLAHAVSQALEDHCVSGTTPADILSALFTVLTRMLRVMKRLELPEDKDTNRQQIARVLQDMLIEFGQKPN